MKNNLCASSNEAAIQNLTELFVATNTKSVMDRITDLYPKIQEFKKGGMKLKFILEGLNKSGFAGLKMATLKTYLHRIKKKNEQLLSDEKKENSKRHASDMSFAAKVVAPRQVRVAKKKIMPVCTGVDDVKVAATVVTNPEGGVPKVIGKNKGIVVLVARILN
jgi:hypothetical protein